MNSVARTAVGGSKRVEGNANL